MTEEDENLYWAGLGPNDLEYFIEILKICFLLVKMVNKTYY